MCLALSSVNLYLNVLKPFKANMNSFEFIRFAYVNISDLPFFLVIFQP